MKIQSLIIMIFLTNQIIMNALEAPKAPKIEKKLEIHNHQRIDNYYWLNEKENPKVIKYLNEENEYCRISH